jgi:hypothetical protein
MGKLSTESLDCINGTQEIVLSGISSEGQRINLPAWISHIKTLAEMPEDIVVGILGATGHRLKRFAMRVNLDHPDIEVYFSTFGKSAIDIFKAATELVAAAQSDKAAGRQTPNMETEFIAQDSSWSRIVRLLQSPSARLLVGTEDRKGQRAIKRQAKNIGLKNILQSGTNAENNFFGQPEHFKRFARGSKFYLEEMKELQTRQELFVSKSMNELANTFAKRMRSLEESISDTLGFYRIKPDEAAIMLARLHGFRWNDSGYINVPARLLKDSNFFGLAEPELEKSSVLEKTVILNTRFVPTTVNTLNFIYQPRMYPLPYFQVALPDKAQKIVDGVEHLSNLNHAPFFDYFWILVPSISLVHPLIQKTKDHWTITEEGSTNIYTDINEAALSLDKLLVKEGYLVPAIIGERDGKCYFVCMMS